MTSPLQNKHHRENGWLHRAGIIKQIVLMQWVVTLSSGFFLFCVTPKFQSFLISTGLIDRACWYLFPIFTLTALGYSTGGDATIPWTWVFHLGKTEEKKGPWGWQWVRRWQERSKFWNQWKHGAFSQHCCECRGKRQGWKWRVGSLEGSVERKGCCMWSLWEGEAQEVRIISSDLLQPCQIIKHDFSCSTHFLQLHQHFGRYDTKF